MKARFSADRIFAGLLLAAPVAIVLFCSMAHAERRLTVSLDFETAAPVDVQLFYDRGAGFAEGDSQRTHAPAGRSVLSFALDAERVTALRLDPSQSVGQFRIGPIAIRQNGQTLRTIPAEAIRALNEIASVTPDGDGVLVRTVTPATDPFVLLDLPQPVESRVSARVLAPAVGLTGLALLVGLALSVFGALSPVAATRALARRPVLVVASAGALAALLSCYPVVFFGKSFASPYYQATPLLYESPPFAPGVPLDAIEHVGGADVGAMAWQSRPWSVDQHAALAAGEAPLWNRYNAMGAPLLGQGISMEGDPLHWIPMLANGAAWAWDLKFVLAKMLFAIGLGLLVLRTTSRPSAAAAVAVSSAFIGFFLFRINHSGFFTLCYAPWILLGWAWLVSGATAATRAGGVVAIVAASAIVFASGALKEAAATLVCLHLAGALWLALSPLDKRAKAFRFAIAGLAGASLLLLIAPQLWAFWETLQGSVTNYDAPHVVQRKPWEIALLFDDLVDYREKLQGFPTLNLFLASGFAWALVSLRTFRRNPAYLATLIACAPPYLFAFGLVPAGLIANTPFLQNIYHIHFSFAYPLLVLGAVLAGWGFTAMIDTLRAREWRAPYLVVSVGLLVSVIVAVAFMGVAPQLSAAQKQAAPVLVVLLICAIVAPLALRQALVGKSTPSVAFAIVLIAFAGLHVRQGMHLRTGIESVDAFTLNPGARPEFSARSQALSQLPDIARGPYRLAGLNNTLFSGYASAVGHEGIGGPDPLRPREMSELMAASGIEARWGWALDLTPTESERDSGFLDLLNVRYLVAPEGRADAMGARDAYPSAMDADVIERPHAWPRAFFIDHVETYDVPWEIVARANTGVGPFAMVSAVDRVGLPASVGQSVTPAHDYMLTPNSTAFTIDASGPGVAVLGETYFRGVRASVDGASARIVRVNHAFRGVAISSRGAHRVEFRFDPDYARVAPLLMMLGVALLALTLALMLIAARRKGAA